MFAFSTCDSNGKTDVVRLDGPLVRQRVGKQKLKKLWKAPNTVLSSHDAKFDFTATEQFTEQKIPEDLDFHCSLTLARLLRSDLRSYALKDLLWVLAGYSRDDESEVKLSARGVGKDYSKVDEDVMRRYQAQDAERGELLTLFLLDRLKEAPAGIREVYDWERRLIWATKRMEGRGIYFRQNTAKLLCRKLERQAADALNEIEHITGEHINPKSDKQVARYLHERLGLPIEKRTAGGAPSTDKYVLTACYEKTKDPVLLAMLKFRSYSGAKSSVEGYIELAGSDSIIHSDINNCGAQTGRQAISNPNLQNVQVIGRDNPYAVPVRMVFGPRPDHFNLHADFASVEMMTLVQYSKDPVMMQAFKDGISPHDLAGEVWYGNRWLRSSGEERKALYNAAKAGNFGWHYGAGLGRMAEILGLSRSEVNRLAPEYRRRFPGAASLPARIREIVMEFGAVTTDFGRRINVPKSKPYVGVNYISQGTAADILKRAQVRVGEYLAEAWGDLAGIILPIHDELVIECHMSLMPKLKEIVHEVTDQMVDAPEMIVPLKVDWQIARRDWAHLEDLAIAV
jgi:DNA polymerase-1